MEVDTLHFPNPNRTYAEVDALHFLDLKSGQVIVYIKLLLSLQLL